MFNLQIDVLHRVRSDIHYGRHTYEEMGNFAHSPSMDSAVHFGAILGQGVNWSL